MTDVLMHDSRRLVLPLETMVDALIEFDCAHKRWPDRVTLQSARLVPSGVVVSVGQPGRDTPTERTYSLAIIAAAVIHYCAKMHVPVPRNASKSVTITQDGVAMVLEGTLFLKRQHDELPNRVAARPQAGTDPQSEAPAVEPVTEPAAESAAEHAGDVPAPASESQPAAGEAALGAAAEGQEPQDSLA